MVVIRGEGLSIADVANVARRRESVSLDESAVE
jgi:histidine ammonia-lyase